MNIQGIENFSRTYRRMKIFRLILYLSLGFICSSLLIFLFGNRGIQEYKALLEYRELLEKNIQDLKAINGKLLEDLYTLKSDPESIALKARELGYFREDERVIRVEGYIPLKGCYEVGKIIRKVSSADQQSWVFNLFTLCIPIALYLFSYIRRKNSRYGNRS